MLIKNEKLYIMKKLIITNLLSEDLDLKWYYIFLLSVSFLLIIIINH